MLLLVAAATSTTLDLAFAAPRKTLLPLLLFIKPITDFALGSSFRSWWLWSDDPIRS